MIDTTTETTIRNLAKRLNIFFSPTKNVLARFKVYMCLVQSSDLEELTKLDKLFENFFGFEIEFKF
jgi:hypothetical protein